MFVEFYSRQRQADLQRAAAETGSGRHRLSLSGLIRPIVIIACALADQLLR